MLTFFEEFTKFFEDKDFVRGTAASFLLVYSYFIIKDWIFLICDTIHQLRIETIRELKNIQDDIGKTRSELKNIQDEIYKLSK